MMRKERRREEKERERGGGQQRERKRQKKQGRQTESRLGACQVAWREALIPPSNKVITSNGVLMRLHGEDKNKL